MAYEYLTFGGVLVLALLLGTGAGAIQNGSFSNHPETIVVNTVKPKTKRAVRQFQIREPTVPADTDWSKYTKATEIAKIPGIQYESRSYGDSLRSRIIYPHKDEWFKKNEENLKNRADSEVKSDELKEIYKQLKTEATPTGAKLKVWCAEKYKQEDLGTSPIREDIWTFCNIHLAGV